MTDARFPERWLNDRRLLRLSADEFRLFALGLTWSVSNRTDGVIYDDDLSLIPGIDHSRAPGWAAGIGRSGLWRRVPGDRPEGNTGDSWLIVEFADTQTSKSELEVLDNVRRRERDKKARQRAKAHRDASQDGEPVSGDHPEGQTGGQHRTGQTRQGQDRHLEPEPDEQEPNSVMAFAALGDDVEVDDRPLYYAAPGEPKDGRFWK